jgi:bifunctional NMN adenylyltransferase/nudix hydrolase
MLGTVRDHLYRDAQWLRAVQVAVEDVLPQATSLRVGIAAGPETGDWSPSFPHWTRARHPHASCPAAAELRHGLFQTPPDQPLPQSLAAAVPAGTLKFLQDFRRSQHFPALQAEFHAIERDRQAWRAAPYPPVFVTTDAVVLCSGHILLVQRGHHPGKGLWALPGGFVDQQERLLAGCLRELLEETSLRVEPAALRAQQVFDAPDRSMRGRTITHAFHFDLGDGTLPAVSGGDDASRAAWLPLAQFFRMEHELFEDHFHIVDSFLGGS